MSGGMSDGNQLGGAFEQILNDLLMDGTDIFIVDDDAAFGEEARGYDPPEGASGTYTFEDRNGIPYDGALNDKYGDLPTWNHSHQVRFDQSVEDYINNWIEMH